MTDIAIKKKIHEALDEILESPKVLIGKDTTGKLSFTLNLNTGGITAKTIEMDLKAVINV